MLGREIREKVVRPFRLCFPFLWILWWKLVIFSFFLQYRIFIVVFVWEFSFALSSNCSFRPFLSSIEGPGWRPGRLSACFPNFWSWIRFLSSPLYVIGWMVKWLSWPLLLVSLFHPICIPWNIWVRNLVLLLFNKFLSDNKFWTVFLLMSIIHT